MSPVSARVRPARSFLITAAVAGLLGSSVGPSLAAGHPGPADVRRACAVSGNPDVMSCLALIRTDVRQQHNTPSGVGYGPGALRNAYRLPSIKAGGGQTVAVVDAFDNPDAAANLATYRKAWGEPPCDHKTGAGCLTKVNQNGKASPLPRKAGHTGWATEESLDVDMVSAICPRCHIILVEASGTTVADLGTGVNSAVRLGARFVSNSYGGKQSKSDPHYDAAYYQHPGVAVTVAAGDNGYGVSYPAASQYVTSVGGASLYHQKSGQRSWTEDTYFGTGSGCSKFEAKPSWQKHKGCQHRIDNDVAAVADPLTGVAVYDSYDQGGWLEVGGTSASSPIIASVFALAGTPDPGSYPSSYPYAHPGHLYDITAGVNGACYPRLFLCSAEKGYDGPTGWGTPDGTAAFAG